jgi:hypothetical protein
MRGYIRRNEALDAFDKKCALGISATNRPSSWKGIHIRAFELPLLASEKTYRKLLVEAIRNGKKKR